MTRFSPTTEFRPGWADRAERFVAAARLALGFERVWPALWPATGIAGLTLAAGLFGLFDLMPWPLHALILAALVTAMALSTVFQLEGVAIPDWAEGARRLERDSALSHRPLSEAADDLAAGRGDAMAEELWRAHRMAQLAALPRFRLSLPRSDLPRRDPKGLRFGVLVLIAFGLVAARGDFIRRIESIFTPNPGVIATLDAWIEPPAYTGQAPVYLGEAGGVKVPAGSILKVRVHGADHRPSMTVWGVRFSGGEGEYAAEAKLTDGGRVRVRAGGHTIGSWRIDIIADRPPSIGFAAAPTTTERQALKISYVSSDDYGITTARAVIKPHNGDGAPLIVELPLPEHGAAPVTLTSFHDLTEHPYAGLEVDITLEAMDAGGNTAKSNTVTFKLPQRIFTDPLARALIELRQILATRGAYARYRAARTLDALTYAPEFFFEGRRSAYLAMRIAYRAVRTAESPAEFKRVEDILWQTAVALERSGILTMAEELRRLQAMLMQKMAQGAPQDEIAALLQRYNQLMQRYLSALAENPLAGGDAQANPNAKMLGDRDLEALLKAIQDLAAAGDRMRAMQLLSMLQSLLENVQISGGQGGSGSGSGNTATDQTLKELGDIMGRQRLLLDKTFRQSDGAGDPKDGGAKGLSAEQGKLKGDLDALNKKSGRKAPGAPDLDKAGRLMDEARQALALGDFPRASTLQKYVLDELRKGAGAIASSGNKGKNPQGQGLDPMGRATNGKGQGGDIPLPDASAMQRARDILMELRRRAGQQGRPKEELDYIDRLLKQF